MKSPNKSRQPTAVGRQAQPLVHPPADADLPEDDQENEKAEHAGASTGDNRHLNPGYYTAAEALKAFAGIMKVFALMIGLFLLIGMLTFIIFVPKCDSGSKAVGLARSLSHERLSVLFEQMKSSRGDILAKESDPLRVERF